MVPAAKSFDSPSEDTAGRMKVTSDQQRRNLDRMLRGLPSDSVAWPGGRGTSLPANIAPSVEPSL